MELNELLGLKNPTMAQLEEQVRQLTEMMSASSHELERINEEERANSAARLVGNDAGHNERTNKKLALLRRQDDIKSVLRQAQAKLAGEQQRLEQVRIDQAWQRVRDILRHQTEIAQKVDAVCDNLIALGVLLHNLNEDAIKAAPIDMRRDLIETQAGQFMNGFHYARAIIAKIHDGLGAPFKTGGGGLDTMWVLENVVRSKGVAGFIKPQQDNILSKAV